MESLIAPLIAFPLAAWFISESIYGAVAAVVIELIFLMMFIFSADKSAKENQQIELERLRLQNDIAEKEATAYRTSLDEHARLRQEERRLYESDERAVMWKYYEDRAIEEGAEAFFEMVFSHIIGNLSKCGDNESTVVYLLDGSIEGAPCLTTDESKDINFPKDDKSIEGSFVKFFDLLLKENPEKKDLLRIFDNTIFSDALRRYAYIDKQTFDFTLQERVFKEVYKIASNDEKIKALFAKYEEIKSRTVEKRARAISKKLNVYGEMDTPNYRQPFLALDGVQQGLYMMSGLSEILQMARTGASWNFSELTAKTNKKRQLAFDEQADYLEILCPRLQLKQYLNYIQNPIGDCTELDFNGVTSEIEEPNFSEDDEKLSDIKSAVRKGVYSTIEAFEAEQDSLLSQMELIKEEYLSYVESLVEPQTPPLIIDADGSEMLFVGKDWNVKKLPMFQKVKADDYDDNIEATFGIFIYVADEMKNVYFRPVKKSFNVGDGFSDKNLCDQFIDEAIDEGDDLSSALEKFAIFTFDELVDIDEEELPEERGEDTDGAEEHYELGCSYLYGTERKENKKKAVMHLKKAVDLNHISAQQVLGSLYWRGEGVKHSSKKAAKLYRQAAEQGDAESQYCLGEMYRDGDGVAQNDSESEKWFEKAAEQGRDEEHFLPLSDYGAFSVTSIEAEEGDSDAQFRLALKYLSGEGCEQDSNKAIDWFATAAKQGHVGAQCNLGVIYATGEWCEKNLNKAKKWLNIAAKQGDHLALSCLGMLYATGDGVEQDDVMAYALWSLCSEFEEVASQNLEKLSEDMSLAEINKAKKIADDFLG